MRFALLVLMLAFALASPARAQAPEPQWVVFGTDTSVLHQEFVYAVDTANIQAAGAKRQETIDVTTTLLNKPTAAPTHTIYVIQFNCETTQMKWGSDPWGDLDLDPSNTWLAEFKRVCPAEK